MSADFRFNEQRAKHVEAVYKTPDVVAQRRDVLRVLGPRRGERILEVGSGPGLPRPIWRQPLTPRASERHRYQRRHGRAVAGATRRSPPCDVSGG